MITQLTAPEIRLVFEGLVTEYTLWMTSEPLSDAFEELQAARMSRLIAEAAEALGLNYKQLSDCVIQTYMLIAS